MNRLISWVAPLCVIIFCIFAMPSLAWADNQCPECQALPTPAQRAACECPETPKPPSCKSGEELVNGQCVKIEQPVTRCGSGETLVNGKCVSSTPSCQSWEKLVSGKCVNRCKAGQRWNGRSCAAVSNPPRCKQGETLVNGECVTQAEVTCPDGNTARSLEECTTEWCPDGETYVLKGHECPPTDCGDGITVPNGKTCPDPFLVATKKACEDARDKVDWLKWLQSGYFLLLLLLLLLIIGLLIHKMNKLEKENHELRKLITGNLPPEDGGGPDAGSAQQDLPRPPGSR